MKLLQFLGVEKTTWYNANVKTEVDESYGHLSLLSSSNVHTITVKRNHLKPRASLRFEKDKDKNRERPRGLAYS